MGILLPRDYATLFNNEPFKGQKRASTGGQDEGVYRVNGQNRKHIIIVVKFGFRVKLLDSISSGSDIITFYTRSFTFSTRTRSRRRVIFVTSFAKQNTLTRAPS